MRVAFTLPALRIKRPEEPAPVLVGAGPALVGRHRRDWFRILAELQGEGFSNAEVARALHLSDTTVRNWKYGIEPLHSKGEALLELHAKYVKRRRRRMRW